jgi:hypothetical protein
VPVEAREVERWRLDAVSCSVDTMFREIPI